MHTYILHGHPSNADRVPPREPIREGCPSALERCSPTAGPVTKTATAASASPSSRLALVNL